MHRLNVLANHLLSPEHIDCTSSLVRAESLSQQVAAGPPVIIGGMVLDIQARPGEALDLQRGGSVPGNVQQVCGGVARNVAECLGLLCKTAAHAQLPLLISVLGEDAAGDVLLAHWAAAGLPRHGIHRLPGMATPCVSVIFDRGGEVAASVADVAALEAQLSPALLRQHRAHIQAAPIVLLDGNLCSASMLAVAEMAGEAHVPLWFEPVSKPKAARALPALHLLHYVSPNAKELVAMADAVRAAKGLPPRSPALHAAHISSSRQEGGSSEAGPHRAAGQQETGGGDAGVSGRTDEEALVREARARVEGLLQHLCEVLAAGAHNVMLTLGRLGAAWCRLSADGGHVEVTHFSALPARLVNTSGAGDCLVAGALWALMRGQDPATALAHGMAAAHSAVESSANVPQSISAAEDRRKCAALLKQLHAWCWPVDPSVRLQ